MIFAGASDKVSTRPELAGQLLHFGGQLDI